MHLLSICLTWATLLTLFVAGVPLEKRQGGGGCGAMLRRRAWHTFSDDEKRDYIRAELCLMNDRRPRTGAPGAQSLYDDLGTVHQLQAAEVHLDGWFLPFHRLFMYTHETLLREECGYRGAQPYWDEMRDADDFASSVLLQGDDLSFGGNGQGDGNCIRDGPFADYTLRIGPGFDNTDHCISRTFNPRQGQLASSESVQRCLELGTFAEAWPCIEGGPHVAGHGGVGGVMNDAISSPGDPLFFLHHAFVDYVWYLWQRRDPGRRYRDIAGFTTAERPPNGWVRAQLSDQMNMHGLVPNRTIGFIMNTENLCYQYA